MGVRETGAGAQARDGGECGGEAASAPIGFVTRWDNKTASDGGQTDDGAPFSGRKTSTFWWTIEGTNENG